MSKFICFVFCALAISFSSIYAKSDESGSNEEFDRLREQCMEKFGVTQGDLYDVVVSGDVTKIKPCYWGCYFTKIGFLNDKGQYDPNNFQTTMRKIWKNYEYFASLEEQEKKCAAVNDKAVSDGEAGCERGALLAECLMKHE